MDSTKKTSKYMVLFRGDTRHPFKDEIFQTGMLPRKKGGTVYQYDSDKTRSVSVSRRLASAPYFPEEVTKKDTWIYVICLPIDEKIEDRIFTSALKDTESENISHSKISNIHGRQVIDIQKTPLKNLLEDSKQLIDPKILLYAHELAVTQIKPSELIAAIPCHREPKNTKEVTFDGGTYTLIDNVLWQNEDLLSTEVKLDLLPAIKSYVKTEIESSLKSPHAIATEELGYHSISSKYQKNPVDYFKFIIKRFVGIASNMDDFEKSDLNLLVKACNSLDPFVVLLEWEKFKKNYFKEDSVLLDNPKICEEVEFINSQAFNLSYVLTPPAQAPPSLFRSESASSLSDEGDEPDSKTHIKNKSQLR